MIENIFESTYVTHQFYILWIFDFIFGLSIKILDPSWEEFRVECLDNFNNSEVQSKFLGDIISTR